MSGRSPVRARLGTLCMVAREVQGGRLKIYCVRTRGFEPHTLHKDTRLAQSVERRTFNPVVVGSSPTLGEHNPIYFFSKNFIKYKLPAWRNWIARRTSNPEVASSSLAVGTK